MIELLPFEKRDYHQLIQWVESPAYLMQWGVNFPLDENQLDEYVEAKGRFTFKVIRKDTKHTVGHISLGRIDAAAGSGQIGKVMVASEQRGTVLGEAMIREMVSFTFHELGLKKVTLGVFDFNVPAFRCYENAGFKKDKLLKNH